MSKDFLKNKWSVVVLALVCCILWGSSFPAVKMLYSLTSVSGTYQKMLLAGMRFSLAGVIVLFFSKLALKQSIRPQRKNIKIILLIALLQTFLGYSFYYIGLSNTTGVRASILVSIEIFNVAILSLFVFKGFKLTPLKIFGMILGLAGIILINTSAFDQSIGIKLNGEVFIFICTIFMAAASVLIKKYAQNMNIVLLNGYQLLLGGAALMAVGYWGNTEPMHFSTGATLVTLYLGVLSAIAFTLWYVLIKHNDVATVSLFKFTIPVFGSLLSILFLPEEHFTLMVIPSLVLIAIGIIIFTKNSKNSTDSITQK